MAARTEGSYLLLLLCSLDTTIYTFASNDPCLNSLNDSERSFVTKLPRHEILELAELCDIKLTANLPSIIAALVCVQGQALLYLRDSIVELGFSNERSATLEPDSPNIILIDCFPYNGEFVVPLRLLTVYPHVDEIVIVEAWQSYSQLRKKDVLYFEQNQDLFAPYADKIRFLPINIPEDSKLWDAEEIVRSYPTDYIRQRWRGHRYVVHFSDADEIPTADALAALRALYPQLSQEPMFLPMQQFSYHFGWQKSHSIMTALAVAGPALAGRTLHYYRWHHPKVRPPQ